jgi:hypothetical protein
LALAVQENMPDGLKMSNRTRQLFYDSAWIAGVDYEMKHLKMHKIKIMKINKLVTMKVVMMKFSEKTMMSRNDSG